MSSETTVERTTFSTTNRDEAYAFFKDLYVDHRLTYDPAGDDFRLEVSSAKAGEVSGGHVRSAMQYGSRSEPDDTVILGVLAAGGLEYRSRIDEASCGPGDAFAVHYGERADALMHDPDIYTVLVPIDRVTRAAQANSGSLREPFVLQSVRPVSPAMNQYFGRIVRMVADQLTSQEDGAFEYPLIARQLVDVAITALLNGFANSTMADGYRPEPGNCGPVAVRRAADFIDDHAAEPIGVSDAAEAAGVDAGELLAAFARDHDASPMDYLRRVRLEGAHRDLSARTPGGGDTVATVAAIAHRWGFANPRLFAAFYRATYRRAPGHTLGEDPT
jgi:AraC-like DNA-binding protein